jgi:dTDP-L-rhamnose 4-epimerase
MHILVTGGAGFIGSFLVDSLIKEGHQVRILDNIEPQVHGLGLPKYLNSQAEFFRGDVKNEEDVKKSLKDVDSIVHFGAMVGVGQSMYQIRRYVDTNIGGTAQLLDTLVNSEHNVKKLIVAASMSSYGEGSYNCESCGIVSPPLRSESQMKSNIWELNCPSCNKILKPIPTPESKTQDINSVYALTKKDQEEMVLNVGKTYGIPSVALRFFNVFGPRQSLSNPYTGVGAIFMSRIKNNNSPLIFEDGGQSRDFISVHDIVQANKLSLEKSSANYQVFNVGSGNQVSIKQVADKIIQIQNKSLVPQVTKQFRKGDVRHCFADISKIQSRLGFEPKVSFDEGMRELVKWSENETAEDKVDIATQELKARGLLD